MIENMNRQEMEKHLEKLTPKEIEAYIGAVGVQITRLQVMVSWAREIKVKKQLEEMKKTAEGKK